MAHRFATEEKEKLGDFVKELRSIGCCNLCVLRYLGVTEPRSYNEENVKKILGAFTANEAAAVGNNNGSSITGEGPEAKQQKPNPCIACLGLLQDGIQAAWLDKIAAEIIGNGIEAVSYCAALSLPIAIQIRAYSIWYYLERKFGDFLTPVEALKPEGTNVKAVWKWLCSRQLKLKVDKNSEWGNTGNVKVEVFPEYEDEEEECIALHDYIVKNEKRKHFNTSVVTRGAVEGHFRKIDPENFFQNFVSPPPVPNSCLKLLEVKCFHEPIFVAGRYCKYSRTLSQTPWIINNVRKTELSVEELLSRHILPAFNATDCRFSSSGREDVDVRTLGKGRPFVFEIINPKKTILTRERMKILQDTINSSTKLISVRDVQVVQKKELGALKHGEESKSKAYAALCVIPDTSGLKEPGAKPAELPLQTITKEHLRILNEYPLPIVLQQNTPIRVLHRRSLATRERRILEMSAVPVKDNLKLFKLFLRTDAGTYVKEFVHGDFGRTMPNIGTILGTEADIALLDVMEIALDWPPSLD